MLGGHIDGLRIGGKVQVELEGFRAKDNGIVLDYTPTSATAIVLLHSENKVVVQPVVTLTPVPEVKQNNNRHK